MKRFFLILTLFLAGSPAFAQSNKTWRDIIEKCNPTQEIGKETLFFGVSNLIGPGSMWRRANDKSIRLVYELSDGFPNAPDQADTRYADKPCHLTAPEKAVASLRLKFPSIDNSAYIIIRISDTPISRFP